MLSQHADYAHMAHELQYGVLETHDDISTVDIREIETKYIQEHTDKTGSLPPGNQKHPKSYNSK